MPEGVFFYTKKSGKEVCGMDYVLNTLMGEVVVDIEKAETQSYGKNLESYKEMLEGEE